MTDTRLAETFLTHPTIDALSDPAHRVYVNGLVYSVSRGTNGEITRRALRLLHPDGAPAAAVAELVAASLWLEVADGTYVIRNFLSYQTSAEQVAKAKELARLRKEKERRKKLDSDLTKAKEDAVAVAGSVTGSLTGSVTNGVGPIGKARAGQASKNGTDDEADSAWPPVAVPGAPSSSLSWSDELYAREA